VSLGSKRDVYISCKLGSEKVAEEPAKANVNTSNLN
jgi:hypothetical protein